MINKVVASAEEAVQDIFDGATLVVEFKTFFRCGQCVEPEVIWTLSMTPDGVHDAGRRHVVAELEKVDELFDRIVRGKSTKDLAATRVAATLRKLLADVEPGVHQLGMLGESNGNEQLEHDHARQPPTHSYAQAMETILT